jgi:hypothetical protein
MHTIRMPYTYIHLSAEKTNTYITKVKIDITMIQYLEMRGSNGQILAKKFQCQAERGTAGQTYVKNGRGMLLQQLPFFGNQCFLLDLN